MHHICTNQIFLSVKTKVTELKLLKNTAGCFSTYTKSTQIHTCIAIYVLKKQTAVKSESIYIFFTLNKYILKLHININSKTDR